VRTAADAVAIAIAVRITVAVTHRDLTRAALGPLRWKPPLGHSDELPYDFNSPTVNT
jgi:hypothetical protein